jgi:hypothetical protein
MLSLNIFHPLEEGSYGHPFNRYAFLQKMNIDIQSVSQSFPAIAFLFINLYIKLTRPSGDTIHL